MKKIGIYAGIVLLFLVLAYGFVPEVLTGKVVNQSDITGYRSMSQEAVAWNNAHPDDQTHWTDSMFGGMPTTSFMPSSDGDWTQSLYNLLLKGKRPANWLFISLLGAFLLMLSLGVDKVLAIGGAVAVTYCSYNFQIIQVGHNTKMQAIAFLPWVLAAVIFTYRSALRPWLCSALRQAQEPDKTVARQGSIVNSTVTAVAEPVETTAAIGWKSWLPKTLLGAVLFGFALSFQIKANHQQITYYLAIMIVIYALYLFLRICLEKTGHFGERSDRRGAFGRFFAASALLLVIGLVGIGTNTIKLAPLYEYTQHTMRGGSELSHPEGGEINNSGLQLDYATAWSYGWEELPNMMIPNFNGGSSAGSVNPDKSEVVKLFRQAGQGNANEIAKSLPLYWGPQPFTAGPMYMGAITIFLFVLGLFLYKGKEKWWLLAATLVAVFLALGSHMMWFTKLFFDYAPMYSKFRTVSMALIVLQFTLPMLGFITLDRILRQEYSRNEFLNAGWIALALTAGFCLLCALIPSIAGSFSGRADAQMQDIIVDALKADRKHILSTDALWSMVLIVVTFGLILWAYSVPKNAPKSYESDPHIGTARRMQGMVGICLLVFVNMFAVGKRYLNSDSFTTPRQFNNQFSARQVDKLILEDKTPSYRVVDLSADIFNDSFNPYWHKCVGGYSPAKLQRYQDLIDRHIVKELQSVAANTHNAKTIQEFQSGIKDIQVLSALNTKYFILGADMPPVENLEAFGPAWFVDSFVPAGTPDEEIALIDSVDLRHTAVIGADFAEARAGFANSTVGGSADRLSDDSVDGSDGLSASAPVADFIRMTSYAPNELRYHYSVSAARTAIFSEVYYPDGWTATVDGAPLDLFRANWIFRAANLPAGEHDIVMRYEPKIYTVSEKASRASSVALFVLLALSLAGIFLSGKEVIRS